MNKQVPTDIRQTLAKAIESSDISTISTIVDELRFAYGLNYQRTYEIAQECSGISLPEWDELLSECDYYNSTS